MTTVIVIAAVILLIFGVERITVTLLTKAEVSRKWIAGHRLCHPNTISLVRIPMGVVSIVIWMLGWPEFSIIWFAFWMITDLSDGTIARNCDLITERGKWLDPLSDKALYFPGLLFFAMEGSLPLIWALAIIVIDTLGQSSRLFIKKTAANHFGKAKTALVTVLLALTAFSQIAELPFLPPAFLEFTTASCAILSFLSFYCKAIPDEWYANSLTLANFLCGAAAIGVILIKEQLLLGFILIFVGQFFDLFDGRLARKYGSTRHGPVYDDIADGTSFGLAVGVLIYDQFAVNPLALALAAVYVASVIFRLQRYLHRQNVVPAGIFEGLPAPAGALLAGSGVLFFRANPVLSVVVVVAAMLLMVSRIRYYHFGREIWPRLPNMLKIIGFVVILLYANYRLSISRQYTGTVELLCFALALTYVCLGNVRLFKKLEY